MATQAVVNRIPTHSRVWRMAADACTLSVFVLGWLAITTIDRPLMFLIVLILAGFLDGIDGLLARRGGGPSFHGAVLDIIADATAFGLAPLVFCQFQARISGLWLVACAIVYMAAVLGRLVRSARQSATQPAHFIGLPMPCTGILLSGLVLVMPASWFFPALFLVSVLAASRRIYPKLAWLWQCQRRWLVIILLASIVIACFHYPDGLAVGLVCYAVYPWHRGHPDCVPGCYH